MARKSLPVILTANDLMEGDAIWWTGLGWSRDLDAALRYGSEAEAAGDVASLAADGAAIGVYAVALDPATGAPASRREAIRAARAPSFAYLPEPGSASRREAA